MSRIIDKLKAVKGIGFIIFALVAGCALLLFSGTVDKKNDSTEAAAAEFDFTCYEKELEKRLEDKINGIDGISKAEVILFIESSYVTEYMTENGGKTAFYERDGDELAAVICTHAPKFRGVAVTCKGAGNDERKKDIIDMLSALLGIPTNKIWVGSG